MTSPSGEYPERSDEDPETSELIPPRPRGTTPLSQGNLWSDPAETPPVEGAPGPSYVLDSRPPEPIAPPPETLPPPPEAGLDAAAPLWDVDATVPLEDGPEAGALLQDTSADESELLGEQDPGREEAETVAAPASGGGVRLRRVAWELAQTLVLAALIFLMVRGVAQNFRVEGPSMEPGLHNGQYLLVNKAVYFKLDLGTLSKYLPFIDADEGSSTYLFHGPQRGDVVVFRYPRDPSRDFIKRIIGVPGDTVSIENGVVSVNGVPLDEPYINGGANSNLEPKVVPEGSYFVLGDNRPNSSDSRNWGFVPEENIIGKAMFSYWPLSDLGGVGNTSIDLGFVKIPLFW